jgi:hypothetical protein
MYVCVHVSMCEISCDFMMFSDSACVVCTGTNIRVSRTRKLLEVNVKEIQFIFCNNQSSKQLKLLSQSYAILPNSHTVFPRNISG